MMEVLATFGVAFAVVIAIIVAFNFAKPYVQGYRTMIFNWLASASMVAGLALEILGDVPLQEYGVSSKVALTVGLVLTTVNKVFRKGTTTPLGQKE